MTCSIRGPGQAICGMTLGFAVFLGCAPDEGAGMAMRDTGMVADTSAPTDSLAIPVPSPRDTLGVEQPRVRVDSVSRPPRGTASRPAPPTRPDTGLKVVHGRVELALDEKTFAPADYLRVRLVGSTGSMETWTNRNGDFSFSDVPPGTREIVFLTGDKIGRVVYRQAVNLGSEPVARLEVVHIPVDSIKRARMD